VALIFSDIEHYVKTCTNVNHATNKLHIPITVSAPASLFTKVYLDIMLMPKAQGIYTLLQQETTFQEPQKDGNSNEQPHAPFSIYLSRNLFVVMELFQKLLPTMDPKSKVQQKNFYDVMEFHNHISLTILKANGVVERGHFTYEKD